MKLDVARTFVRQFARNAGDTTTYPDADIDRAIYAACVYFCRETKVLRYTSSETTAAGNAGIGPIDNKIHPERVLWARSGNYAMSIISLSALYALREKQEANGTPTYLAFNSLTGADLYPTPNANGSVKLHAWTVTPIWTFGDIAASTIELEIPDIYMPDLLIFGATSLVQFTQPEQAYTSRAWQQFVAFTEKMKSNIGYKGRVVNAELEE